ncbi:hypothetical protein H0N99_04445 [Candidatus Micrarchaeota archaeon]|nr:hypothetical protein [Candidatus Micrarchaeota archaeon]
MKFDPSGLVIGTDKPSNNESSIRMGKDGFDITFRRGKSSHVVSGYHLFMLHKVKSEFNVPAIFTRKLKGTPFSILYDFEEEKIYMVTLGAGRRVVESIFEGAGGLGFEYLSECLDEEIDPKTLWKYIAFPLPEHIMDYREAGERSPASQARMYYDPERLADIYNAMKGEKTKMLVSFVPASEAELEKERAFYEKEITYGRTGGVVKKEKKVSLLVLLGNALSSQFTTTPVRDLDKGAVYEETTVAVPPKKFDVKREYIARTIVAMCDNARLTNDAIFRVTFIGYGENSDLLEMHFRSKFPCVKEPVSQSEELTFGIPQGGGDVMSGLFASNFIYFPKDYELGEKGLKEEGTKPTRSPVI